MFQEKKRVPRSCTFAGPGPYKWVCRARPIGVCLGLVLGWFPVVCLPACDKHDQPDGRSRPLRVLNQSEVQTLDPARISWMVDIRVADLLFDGLTQYEPQTLNPLPCIAQRWTIDNGGKTYTFYLRHDARWSNGDPVTAEDFVYSWKRTLEPATAADYVYLLFVIRDAQRYSEGLACAAEPPDQQARLRATGHFVEPIPFDQVGIHAVDAHTLRVDLVAAVPYFLDLTSFITFKPVHRATLEKFAIRDGDKIIDTDTDWYRRPANLVCNGPYVLRTWAQRQYMRLEKRADYWNAAAVPSERIEILPVDSPATAFKMYEAGEADIMPFSPPRRLAERLIAQARNHQRGDVHTTPMFGTYFYRLNTRRKPFEDPRVRVAFARAIDRRVLTDRLLWMGEAPAGSLVPPGTRDYLSPPMPSYDLQAARDLLAQAGYPGGRGLPPVEIIFNKEASHQTIAEAIKDMWQRNLGVQVDLQSLDRGSLRKKVQTLDYSAGRGGWYGDYNDPITFLDLFTTAPEGGGNNDTGFSNPEYDDLLERAKVESDPQKRNALLRQAEEILLTQMPIIPLYYYAEMYLYDDARVTGFYVNKMGTNPLRWVGLAGYGREGKVVSPLQGLKEEEEMKGVGGAADPALKGGATILRSLRDERQRRPALTLGASQRPQQELAVTVLGPGRAGGPP
jgi:oligopeptide transport system substrate-binding protein